MPRRAPGLLARLTTEGAADDPLHAIDWVNLWALAVNEANASGGRVVTARATARPSAARHRGGVHTVSLDMVVKTMGRRVRT